MLDVNILENHDEALDVWEARKVKDSTVIHFDAHFDCEPLKKHMYINIGNFLRHAINKKIINKIIWVLPDSYSRYHCCKRYINRQMKTLGEKITPFNCFKSYLVDGVHVSICTLDELAQYIQAFCEPILLDIDMDYFFQDHLCMDYTCIFTQYDPNCLLNFYKCIKPLVGSAKTITICKSVNGGFTPLRYDYCASHLSSLFENKPTKIFECLNELILSWNKHPEIECIQRCLLDQRTRLSTICLLIENGCDKKINQYVLDILHIEYEDKVKYINSIYQVIRIGDKRLISKCLPLAEFIDNNLYAYLCMIINEVDGIPMWTSDMPLILKCKMAEYMFIKQQYNISFQILKDIQSSFNTINEFQSWEGIISSHLASYQISPIRIKMNKLLCITAYKVHENKVAYTSSKFLLHYGYGDYVIQTIYNSFTGKHIRLKDMCTIFWNKVILFLCQCLKKFRYRLYLWKSGRQPFNRSF